MQLAGTHVQLPVADIMRPGGPVHLDSTLVHRKD